MSARPFRFRDAVRLTCPTGVSAATLREFRDVVERVEPRVLHHHLREVPLRFTFTFWDYPNDFAIWAANALNNAYYDDLAGRVTTIAHLDGTLERPDPWQNPASVALQVYFSQYLSGSAYSQAIGPDGFAAVYARLFGNPWQNRHPHIPGDLQQPAFQFPFEPGKIWAYTGGPHTGYGISGAPFAAIDLAPPSTASGCIPSGEWVTAVADGVVARAEDGLVVLDLDGDGDERTGWDIIYLHVIHDDSIAKGLVLHAGDRIGHPSCERGEATGTHAHIARKYNGEWIEAGGIIPLNFEGWVVHAGSAAYEGTMVKNGRTVTACTCSDHNAMVQRGQ